MSKPASQVSFTSKGGSSQTSDSSSSSSAVARKRAKAEAARARLAFLEKQLEVSRYRAEVEEKRKIENAKNERLKSECDAHLQMLVQAEELAAAEAEADALENCSQGRSSHRTFSPDRLPIKSSKTRTQEYVDSLDHRISLNPEAEDFIPQKVQQTHAYDFTKFLLKKDLLLSRLSHYNDMPETFAVWRSSFQIIVDDLDVSPREELDLLVKYLGPESSKHAQSLRSCNVHDPEKALTLLWKRLEERFGSPELVEACLRKRIDTFPQISQKDSKKLYDLCDLLTEIDSIKEDPKLGPLFAVYDTSIGVNRIIEKLPYSLQQKWVSQASHYKQVHNVPFPPFTFLCEFISNMSKIMNDPAFQYNSVRDKKDTNINHKSPFKVVNRKTDFNPKNNDIGPVSDTHTSVVKCPIHKANHPLSACKVFLSKPFEDRISFLKEKNICFKCLNSTEHQAKKCNVNVRCEKCSRSHLTVMHRDHEPTQSLCMTSSGPSASTPPAYHGGEVHDTIPSTRHGGENQTNLTTSCTSVCGAFPRGRSCGKVVLVQVYSDNQPEKVVPVYAILDDQSNRTLASPALLDELGIVSPNIPYSLTSCAGSHTMTGRRVQGLCVQSLNTQTTFKLSSVIECSNIPDERSEIPTPHVASHHAHLSGIAQHIPHLRDVPTGLLIGRDVPEAHHVLEQIIGTPGSPFAQRLHLGWVIIGDVCIDKMHPPTSVCVTKTNVLQNGRGTIFTPCSNDLKITELGDDVFEKTKDDDKLGMSVDDRKFMTLMDKEFQKNEEGRWSAPLPLRSSEKPSVNNRSQALSRALILDRSLKRDPVKREHFFKFMAKILNSGAAEEAPPLTDKADSWYLPLFGIYHPKKPNKIRGVFDSSATFDGISLNSMMYSGPDLTNSLIGILLRFRRNVYAVSADIEQMFYQFFVHEEFRNYLRFFWYKDNVFSEPLVEHRMTVHVFGNSPSPAVATYGLRKTVSSSDIDVKDFVSHDFYIDDGVTSLSQKDQAVSLLKRTRTNLMQNGQIRLHKIASNSRGVLSAFPTDDLAEELQCLDPLDTTVPLPVHNCLGLPWDLATDSFQMCLHLGESSFTRRGILSTLNGIYDPLGFLAPCVIAGKILLREIAPDGKVWDDPLSESQKEKWERWKHSLETLHNVEIPRMYVPTSLTQSSSVEFHVFCDASESAISSVAYVKSPDSPGALGFVMGKAKVAPLSGHTIPRLELCSAVLATELWQLISENLGVLPEHVTFYTDSKVVLGYINNESRRFYTYVSNRVERIRRISDPSQWQYVPSELNPADVATRCSLDDLSLKEKIWLQGPKDFLEKSPASADIFPIVSPDHDIEIRPLVRKNELKEVVSPLSRRFEKFSAWDCLVRAFTLLRHVCRSFHSPTDSCRGWHSCLDHYAELRATETWILKTVQHEAFQNEIECLRKGHPIPRSSPIVSLSPFLDTEDLLRVGGRLYEAKDTVGLPSVHPLILPKKNHVSRLIVQHHHKKMKHQGRHFTEGALRSSGFWIVGAKRLVESVIHDCFQCRRLRGPTAHQHMANLPVDRVVPSAPFSHVGVDVFGPWSVTTRKTRGGQANSKRWAVIFTCMAIRAIHIEVLEGMSSSSFINAFRRFVALRGPVIELRSDRGTNFIGAAGDIGADSLFVEGGPVCTHLLQSGIKWKFNPPHASHMGGSWERMIGVVRRILDSMLLDQRRKPLTHEVLCTLMAEICAIVNSRPITPVSHDPASPLVLTPSILLTMKSCPDHIPCESSDMKEAYKYQWKQVQVLANFFWKHWKEEYLQTLQQRRKWKDVQPNITEGDLVLLKDSGTPRNDWSIGLVVRTFPSGSDLLVRTAEIRVVKGEESANYIRPITELVPL